VAQWRGGIGTPAASSREGNETTALVAVANPAAVRTTEEQLEMVAGEQDFWLVREDRCCGRR
jgi:hypothetical protein